MITRPKPLTSDEKDQYLQGPELGSPTQCRWPNTTATFLAGELPKDKKLLRSRLTHCLGLGLGSGIFELLLHLLNTTLSCSGEPGDRLDNTLLY